MHTSSLRRTPRKRPLHQVCTTSRKPVSSSPGLIPYWPQLGLLTGMMPSSGTYHFTVRATAPNGCTGEQDFTLTCIDCTPITISPGPPINPDLPLVAHPLPSGRIATP